MVKKRKGIPTLLVGRCVHVFQLCLKQSIYRECLSSRHALTFLRFATKAHARNIKVKIQLCCVRCCGSGKYGYETARGLAMHCRLEKLLSGEAHTLQKGMLAVFKPIMNSQTAHASGESAVPLSKTENQGADDVDQRKPDALKPRVSPRPPGRTDNAPREAESDLVAMKTEVTQEATGLQKAQTGSTYSDMLTLMSQAISRKPGSFTEDAPETVVKPAESAVRNEIKELADPSVGEHFLAAVAAAAAACDVPGFDD